MIDMMDVSPLPHKAPFTSYTEIYSPTPGQSPAGDYIMMESPAPRQLTLEPPKPVMAE